MLQKNSFSLFSNNNTFKFTPDNQFHSRIPLDSQRVCLFHHDPLMLFFSIAFCMWWKELWAKQLKAEQRSAKVFCLSIPTWSQQHQYEEQQQQQRGDKRVWDLSYDINSNLLKTSANLRRFSNVLNDRVDFNHLIIKQIKIIFSWCKARFGAMLFYGFFMFSYSAPFPFSYSTSVCAYCRKNLLLKV